MKSPSPPANTPGELPEPVAGTCEGGDGMVLQRERASLLVAANAVPGVA